MVDAIDALGRDAPGLDIVPLAGRGPWRRLREGDWRILHRPLSADEARHSGMRGRGYLVDRVVNRRDLDQAVRGL
jgi:hypothetical protein